MPDGKAGFSYVNKMSGPRLYLWYPNLELVLINPALRHLENCKENDSCLFTSFRHLNTKIKTSNLRRKWIDTSECLSIKCICSWYRQITNRWMDNRQIVVFLQESYVVHIIKNVVFISFIRLSQSLWQTLNILVRYSKLIHYISKVMT